MIPHSIPILPFHIPHSPDIILHVFKTDQARRGVLRISASHDRSDVQPIAPRQIDGHDEGELGED